MTTEQILIPAAAVLATVSLNAWINTKIKFAKDQSDAMQGIRNVLQLVVFSASQLYVAVSLVLQLASNAPLTRGSLATILIACFGLYTLFMFYWVFRLLRMVERLMDRVGRLTDIVGRLPRTKEDTAITADPPQPNPSLQPTAASTGTSGARDNTAPCPQATSPSSGCG
jgi:hypothetical protein